MKIILSYESGILEDPAIEAPTDMYQLTKNVEETPDVGAKISLQFKSGVPIELKDESSGVVIATEPVAIMVELNKIA